MPVTRKSTRSRGGATAAAAAQGKQQTLSFNHRVTKPTVKTGKDLLVQEKTPETVTKTKDVKVEPKVEDEEVVEVAGTESEDEHDDEEEAQAKAKANVKKAAPAKKAAAKAKANVKKAAPAKKAAAKDVKREIKEEEPKEQVKEKEPERTEVEKRALKLPQSAIDAYWLSIDSARMARAVHKKHTEGLTTGEKVLRYFDVNSHYGPCIGITRLKRWQRAERLGLNPPLEVLAVLLREDESGNTAVERAHMDELMNSVSTGP
ncbi:DNA polymerase delta, subunit 4-domain-containing protein [Pseudoneurospora amorphoporcata]|uniref:DNA polymerase delta, subunit 4-domain-containing protein n=1 Tax=Pseudoneurospora amorphoporcata TaxID=241081 RepID=A0AAN6NQ41_9PEZI|nr:DNA polymerase delta, subunit 4-domain-containing protein [Pseudoneurospora amorphoporcata]